MSRSSQRSRLDKKITNQLNNSNNLSGPSTANNDSQSSNSKFSDQDWCKLIEKENNHEFIFDYVNEILQNVDENISINHTNKMLSPFVIKQASETILSLFNWPYINRDIHIPFENYYDSETEPSPMPFDSLAQGCLPIVDNINKVLELNIKSQNMSNSEQKCVMSVEPVLPMDSEGKEVAKQLVIDIINSLQIISHDIRKSIDKNANYVPLFTNDETMTNLHGVLTVQGERSPQNSTNIKVLNEYCKFDSNLSQDNIHNATRESNAKLSPENSIGNFIATCQEISTNNKPKFKKIPQNKLPSSFITPKYSVVTPSYKSAPNLLNRNKNNKSNSDLTIQVSQGGQNFPHTLLDSIKLSDGVVIKHNMDAKTMVNSFRQIKSANLSAIKNNQVDISDLIKSRAKVIPPPVKYQTIPPIPATNKAK